MKKTLASDVWPDDLHMRWHEETRCRSCYCIVPAGEYQYIVTALYSNGGDVRVIEGWCAACLNKLTKPATIKQYCLEKQRAQRARTQVKV